MWMDKEADLTPAQRLFIETIMKGTERVSTNKKLKKGIRYTWDEKLLCLSILNRSHQTYRYLRTFFNLPSESVLQGILQTIEIDTGINPSIQEKTTELSECLNAKEKICALAWDEMELQTHLDYDSRTDRIHGTENWQNDTIKTLADHAYVFLIRSI